ncbi:MAG: hypothetical protein KDB27_07610, partial [Planctomycetales bacterium]|nr:hypothetical protein [Planctomycetales bacterium]
DDSAGRDIMSTIAGLREKQSHVIATGESLANSIGERMTLRRMERIQLHEIAAEQSVIVSDLQVVARLTSDQTARRLIDFAVEKGSTALEYFEQEQIGDEPLLAAQQVIDALAAILAQAGHEANGDDQSQNDNSEGAISIELAIRLQEQINDRSVELQAEIERSGLTSDLQRQCEALADVQAQVMSILSGDSQ